ncbi:MAG: M48 family metalloprotease [Methylotenera sp.]
MLNKPQYLLAIILLSVSVSACVAPQTRMPGANAASTEEETKKQQLLVLDDYLNNYRKLQTVSSRVITSGADMCGDKVGAYYGFDYWNQDSFNTSMKETAKTKYNISEKFKILNVAPQSPAELGELKAGDTLVSIDNWLVPIGKDSIKQLKDKLALSGKTFSPVEIVVSRDSAEKKVTITPVKSCDFSVFLAPDDVKNAYADGKNIVVYKGMMDFFKADEEIALVLSHELAHNSMKHIDAKQKNAMVGGIFGLLLDVAAAAAGVNTNGEFAKTGAGLAGNSYSVEFEQEADYVGLYFMKKAGYEIEHAADFWRRMAVNNSQAITVKSSHPTTPQRFVAIESTVKEINTKIANGETLIPELKNTSDQPAQPAAKIEHTIN